MTIGFKFLQRKYLRKDDKNFLDILVLKFVPLDLIVSQFKCLVKHMDF
jgi:hypothetical protein